MSADIPVRQFLLLLVLRRADRDVRAPFRKPSQTFSLFDWLSIRGRFLGDFMISKMYFFERASARLSAIERG